MTIKRFGELCLIAVTALALIAASRTGVEWWLVPWSTYRVDQQARRDAFIRDSLFQQEVLRFVRYAKCKEKHGSRACLDPDRP